MLRQAPGTEGIQWPGPVTGESVEDATERVYKWAQAIFVWSNDYVTYNMAEHWPTRKELEESYRNNAGLVWDDCDGFCALCRYAFNDLGILTRILTCNVSPKDAVPTQWGNHAVLTVEGTGKVLDQRQALVVSRQFLERQGYDWIGMSDVRPGQPWSQPLKD